MRRLAALLSCYTALCGCTPAPNISAGPGPSYVRIGDSGLVFFGDTDQHASVMRGNFDNGAGSDLYATYVVPGMEAGQHRDWTQDIVFQSRAIQLDPNLVSARIARAGAYMNLAQLDAALVDLSAVIDGAKVSWPKPEMLQVAYLMRADVYATKRLYGPAIMDDTTLISMAPGTPAGWNQRCWHRAMAGVLGEALADCNQALLLDPNSANIIDSLAFVHFKMRDYQAATAEYGDALRRNPKLASSLYGLGLVKQASGAPGGEADIAAATRIDPQIAQNMGVD